MIEEQQDDGTFRLSLKEQHCRFCPAFALNVCRVGVEAFASERITAAPVVKQKGWMGFGRRHVLGSHDLDAVVPFICDGWAAHYVNMPAGSRQIISFLLPGEPVSAAAVFEPIQGCRIEAITDVHFRTFRRDEFTRVLFAQRNHCEMILRYWVEEKTRSDYFLVTLGQRRAEVRILRLILKLIERLEARGTIKSYEEEIPFPLRHHHIADAAGLTTEHVTKSLASLRQQNILEINNRFLSILDPAAFFRSANSTPA